MHNNLSKFLIVVSKHITPKTPLLCGILLMVCCAVLEQPVLAQANTTPNAVLAPTSKVSGNGPAASKKTPDLSEDFILNFGKGAVPGKMPGVSLELDWTTCQVHRVHDFSPLSITLNGNIISDIATIWTLTPQATRAVGPANLKRVEDVMRRPDPAGRITVPLTWAISLDGGAFEPMHVTPDYRVTTVFPPGMHTFRLQISGRLQPDQPDGYYRLQLGQNLTPQL